MLRRQEELENGTAWSISSESSDDSSSPQLSSSTRHAAHKPIVQPEVQASAPAIEISFSQQQEETGAGGGIPAGTDLPGPPEEQDGRRKDAVANGHVPYTRTLSHISEASVDASMEAKATESPWEPSPSLEEHDVGKLDNDSLPGASNSVPETWAGKDSGPEAKPRAMVAWAATCEVEAEAAASPAAAQDVCGSEAPTPAVVLAQAPAEEGHVPAPHLATSPPAVPRVKAVDSGLEEAISLLASALDDYRGQFPELQPLERELKHLEEILLVRGPGGSPEQRTVARTMALPRAQGWWGHPWWHCSAMRVKGASLVAVTKVVRPCLIAVTRDEGGGGIPGGSDQ